VKRLLIFLVFLLLVLFSFWFLGKKQSPTPSLDKKTEVGFDDFRQGMKKIVFQNQEFLFLEQKIKETQKLHLFPNFEEKLPATELFEKNNCLFLTNGGFYDQQGQPLGWFFAQEKLFQKEIKSALFNGFFFKDKENKVFIEKNFPSRPIIWGLQTGPILILRNQPLKMNLVKDQHARRIVAAVNHQGELFFFVITGSESLASGPLLSDLPFLLAKIGQELGESFEKAINLDGGTASAFINKEKTIKEYTRIGSFFCLSF